MLVFSKSRFAHSFDGEKGPKLSGVVSFVDGFEHGALQPGELAAGEGLLGQPDELRERLLEVTAVPVGIALRFALFDGACFFKWPPLVSRRASRTS